MRGFALKGEMSLVFRLFRKIASISFVMSVRPSVRMAQLGFHWKDFHEICYLSVFRKFVQKIQFSLKFESVRGILHKDQCTYMVISRLLILRSEMFQAKVI